MMRVPLLLVLSLSLAFCAPQEQDVQWSTNSTTAPTDPTQQSDSRSSESSPRGGVDGMSPIPDRPPPIRYCVGNILYSTLSNAMFYGNLLGASKSLGEQACANLCYEHPYCETANFIVESYVCELNSESRAVRQSWYKHKQGVNMIENVRCDAGALGTCGQANVEPRLSSASIAYAINPKSCFGIMTEVRPNSFPWLVSIQRDRHHVCSAVLISEYDVLTSASCFTRGANPAAYQAILGAHSAGSPDPGQQTSQVAAIAIHDQYNPSWSREHDLALVRLSSKANISPNTNIRPVCIPFSTAVFPEICLTVGWGRISGGAAVDKMSEIVVPAVGRDICNQPEWYNGQVTDSMLCAGYSRAIPCQSDIGGPLLCQLNGTWSVFGVGSWGEGCARSFKPTVYTNVPYFANWIRSKITV